MSEADNDPCATCLRWSECNGVDAEGCPMIIEEGEHEEEVGLREVLPDTGSGGVGISEMVRRISGPGNRPEALCFPLDGV